MNNITLHLEDVSYSYNEAGKERQILNKINYSFEEGKFYSIVGPSGSGKTTLLSVISGLDQPKQGTIKYKDKKINKIGLTNFRSKYVGIVFQSYNLLSYMNAHQNVKTAIEICGVKSSTTITNLLSKVGINEVDSKRNILKLSGGQQQRVAIARALAKESNLLIADEPTGNLDSSTAQDIINIFKKLAHEENKCVIVVTHSKQLADESDVVLTLNDGNLVI
ncbi:MAG: transporter [Bacillales bacterium]|jgi:putative ABC transport system ATP-binding protein|nr:transporter [Bacillales bacterium]